MAPDGPLPASCTLLDLFHRQVERRRRRVAFRHKRGGVWHARTWDDWESVASEVAAGLCALGVTAGARVALLSGTRMCWVEADVGILLAGAATVAIYPTLRPEAVAHILRDSGAQVLFAEDPRQVEKLYAGGGCDHLRRVVVFDAAGRSPASEPGGRTEPGLDAVVPERDRQRFLSWSDFLELGRARRTQHPGELADRRADLGPESVASLVYTSGTSGPPKGVVLSHESFVFETEVVSRAMPVGVTDEQLLFLPLAHVFARLTIFLQMRVGFTTALSREAIFAVEDCATVRPTFLVSVPRLYEKVHEAVMHSLDSSGPMRRRLCAWAFGVGRSVAELRAQGREPRGRLAIEHRYAHRLVFAAIHERLGGHIRFLISGAAPLGRETAEFFHSAGLLLLEGYGLTEAAGAVTANLPHHFRVGTVGQPLPRVEVKVARGGEILVRGRNVMSEYHGLPRETREVLDSEGWLHTGDVGRFDEDGFLIITDRKKDLFITSSGKKIAPRKLEQALEASPYVSHAIIVADRRPYAVALLVFARDPLQTWARGRGVSGDFRSIVRHPDVPGLAQSIVDEVNAGLASHETVKRVAVLQDGLTLERGELTPTLEVRRSVVEARHASLIDSLYV